MATVGELHERKFGQETTVPTPGVNPPVAFDRYTSSSTKIDHSGDWWVMDRDTGEVYKQGLLTREGAEKWARRKALAYLPAAEAEQVTRGDPIVAAYIRSHPDVVLVSTFDRPTY